MAMQFTYEFELYLRGKTVEAYIPDLRAVVEADEHGWQLVNIEACYRELSSGPLLWRSLLTMGWSPLDALSHQAAVEELLLPRHVKAIEALWVDLQLFYSEGSKPRLTPAHQHFGGI